MQINHQTIGCLSLTKVLEVASGFDLSLAASQKYHLTVDFGQLKDSPQNQMLTANCCIVVARVAALASMLPN